MGRFTQIDPFAGALAVPSSLNGYAYGHGNPARYTDPEGLCGPLCWLAIAAVGATLFGGAAYGYQVHSNMQQGMDFWSAAYYKNINWPKVAGAAAVGAVALPALYLGYLGLGYAYVYGTSTLPAYASYLYGAHFVPTALGLEITGIASAAGALYSAYGASLANQVMPYIPPLAAGAYILANEIGWIPPEMHQEVAFGTLAGYEVWSWERITHARMFRHGYIRTSRGSVITADGRVYENVPPRLLDEVEEIRQYFAASGRWRPSMITVAWDEASDDFFYGLSGQPYGEIYFGHHPDVEDLVTSLGPSRTGIPRLACSEPQCISDLFWNLPNSAELLSPYKPRVHMYTFRPHGPKSLRNAEFPIAGFPTCPNCTELLQKLPGIIVWSN